MRTQCAVESPTWGGAESRESDEDERGGEAFRDTDPKISNFRSKRNDHQRQLIFMGADCHPSEMHLFH